MNVKTGNIVHKVVMCNEANKINTKKSLLARFLISEPLLAVPYKQNPLATTFFHYCSYYSYLKTKKDLIYFSENWNRKRESRDPTF